MYSGNGGRRERIKRKFIRFGILLLVGAALFCAIAAALRRDGKKEREGFGKKAVLWVQEEIKRTYLPVFAFVEGETGRPENPPDFFRELALSVLPLYQYKEEQDKEGIRTEDEDTYDLLIRREGMDEEYKEVEEDGLEYEDDALHIDGDLQNAMLKENSLHNETDGETEQEEEKAQQEPAEEERNEGI